jgi:hypothetical protein
MIEEISCQANRLALLPIEVLNLITRCLFAWEVTTLWFCGCFELNRKMANGAVTHFEYRPYYEGYTVSDWPTIASEFRHLKAFYIEDQDDCSFIPMYASLSPSIRKLSILRRNDAFILEASVNRNPSLFPNLTHLTILGDGMMDPFTIMPNVLKLPSLLKITTKCPILVAKDLNPSSIPPNITKWRSTQRMLNIEGQFASFLISLRLRVKTMNDIFPILPENLMDLSYTSIAKDRVAQYKISVDSWKYLSVRTPNLTSLNIFAPDFSSTHAKSLPINSLQSLTIIGRPRIKTSQEACEIIRPLSLSTSLTSMSGLWPESVTPEVAKLLPRGLNCGVYVKIAHDAAHLFPTNVSNMRLATTIDSDEEEDDNDDTAYNERLKAEIAAINKIQGLPRLNHLSIYTLTSTLLSHLPPTLEGLSLVTLKFGDEEDGAKLISQLPRSLRAIWVNDGRNDRVFELWKHLPTYLEELDLLPFERHESNYKSRFMTFPPYSSLGLPRHLTSFCIGLFTIEDSKWFDNLPRTLETLKIALKETPSDSFQRLELACPSLTHLETSWIQCLDDFPRFLETLPRTLRICHFTILPMSMKDSLISTVPISITANMINDEHLHNLPPKLKKLRLPTCPSVTGSCAKKLPKSLTTLEVELNPPAWFEAHLESMQDNGH